MKRVTRASTLLFAGLLFFVFLNLAPGARAQALREPAWPHRFEVMPGETATSGFLVTQPGPVVITADWQGAPLIVTLHGPLAKPIVQTASGHVQITYQASPNDVQKSHLWAVSFAPQGNPPTPGFGRAAPLATGTLTVQHPPADANLALPQLRDLETRFNQQRAMAKQTALATIPSAGNKLSSAGTGLQEQAAPDPQRLSRLQARSSVPVLLVKDFSPASLHSARGQLITKNAPTLPPTHTPLAPPQTLSPVPMVPRAQKGEAMLLPQPQIDPQRSHADQVMVCCQWSHPYGLAHLQWQIYGSNFGSTQGELHFVINGKDTALGAYWDRDFSYVQFEIPRIPLSQQTDVQIYIKTAGGLTTNRVTFHYAATSPQITGILYAIMGNPNLIDLIGTFFGDTQGEVHFVDTNGNDTLGSVTSWTLPAEHPGDTFVVVSPSLAYFRSGFDGSVYVKVRGMDSNRVPIHFDPAPIVTVALPIDRSGLAKPLDNQFWPVIAHSSDFFVGYRGDDQFFVGKTLKNGWVVDSVAVSDVSVHGPWWGNVGLYLSRTPAKGSTDPSTTVHWYVDASDNSAQYQLVVNIRGPQGAPYW